MPVNMSLIYYSHTTQQKGKKKNPMKNHKSKNELVKKKMNGATPFEISIADSRSYLYSFYLFIDVAAIVALNSCISMKRYPNGSN